jgi:hypothetical protein
MAPHLESRILHLFEKTCKHFVNNPNGFLDPLPPTGQTLVGSARPFFVCFLAFVVYPPLQLQSIIIAVVIASSSDGARIQRN